MQQGIEQEGQEITRLLAGGQTGIEAAARRLSQILVVRRPVANVDDFVERAVFTYSGIINRAHVAAEPLLQLVSEEHRFEVAGRLRRYGWVFEPGPEHWDS